MPRPSPGGLAADGRRVPRIPGLVPAQAPPSKPWTIAHRSIGQGRASGRFWQIDYWLRNDGEEPATIRPESVAATLDGLVSNSRVAAHASPRPSKIAVSGSSGLCGTSEVIASSDDARRCREKAVLQAWPAARGDDPPEPVSKATVRLVALTEQPSWTVPPGGVLRVRLRLEHDHFLYGPYEPLLGPRTLAMKLGGASLRDVLPLDREGRIDPPDSPPWPGPGDPPADRRDHRVFVSAPDSLHLEAHVPGDQSYRFKECPVKYGSRMRLRYWYLVSPGTEGDCKARIVQYRDAPTAWKILSDGDIDQVLAARGRWTKVERIFRTESEATTLTLEFRLLGDVGEMWIDDVSLEPLDEESHIP